MTTARAPRVDPERKLWRHEQFQYATTPGPEAPLWCVTHGWAYDRLCLACLDETIRDPFWS